MSFIQLRVLQNTSGAHSFEKIALCRDKCRKTNLAPFIVREQAACTVSNRDIAMNIDGQHQVGPFAVFNKQNLQLRQSYPALSHIFASAVGIAGLARLLASQKQELARAFIGIDFGG
jgi:hypothetical protein